ncbi:MAG: hypothetical protein WA989_05785 [Henriciella sp.]|uniref:hypothetical protein n=1 Tax=Henriciella sp. TaxID=1968823 RepID=UPI003C71AC3C
MKLLVTIGVAALALSACQGANCADKQPAGLTVAMPEAKQDAAKSAALDEIYERYPTRAMVDASATTARARAPGVYDVHVEMTGSPEARAIYDVVVTETPDGTLEIRTFYKTQ